MKYNLIMAIDLAGNIGKGDGLPWKQRTDLIRFKELTHDSTVVMGRKTFESIGKPLPYRLNIVVTSNKEEMEDKYGDQILNLVFVNFDQLKEHLDITHFSREKVFFIGGRSIWEWAFDNEYVDYVYLTSVLNSREDLGDVKYPEVHNRLENADVVYDMFTKQDDKNDFNCRFYKLKMK